jgi:hypothetical protein
MNIIDSIFLTGFDSLPRRVDRPFRGRRSLWKTGNSLNSQIKDRIRLTTLSPSRSSRQIHPAAYRMRN